MKKLSIRQAQVQTMLLAGMTMAQISLELGVKVSTVKTHIEKIYRKRGFKSRRNLAHIELDEAKLAIKLTRQQLQVLKGILAGKSFQQIATEMALSLRTVHSHRYRLYKKMGVGTRAQVIALINKNQLVNSETSDIGLPALVS